MDDGGVALSASRKRVGAVSPALCMIEDQCMDVASHARKGLAAKIFKAALRHS